MNQHKHIKIISLLCLSCFISPTVIASPAIKPAPNGIELPANYKDWKVISQSHRTDNKTMRIILGNDIAVKAARSGNTNPWPKGSILGKMVWKQKAEAFWPTAIAPDKFVHAEFMVKDGVKFRETGGWGYARWLGKEQKPYGKDKSFANECVACHTPVKQNDYVFTTPAFFP